VQFVRVSSVSTIRRKALAQRDARRGQAPTGRRLGQAAPARVGMPLLRCGPSPGLLVYWSLGQSPVCPGPPCKQRSASADGCRALANRRLNNAREAVPLASQRRFEKPALHAGAHARRARPPFLSRGFVACWCAFNTTRAWCCQRARKRGQGDRIAGGRRWSLCPCTPCIPVFQEGEGRGWPPSRRKECSDTRVTKNTESHATAAGLAGPLRFLSQQLQQRAH
jgi:hypothetical protein